MGTFQSSVLKRNVFFLSLRTVKNLLCFHDVKGSSCNINKESLFLRVQRDAKNLWFINIYLLLMEKEMYATCLLDIENECKHNLFAHK